MAVPLSFLTNCPGADHPRHPLVLAVNGMGWSALGLFVGGFMKPEDFGPVHSCPKCGMAIQYVQRRGGNVPEEMLTGGRHHCKHIKGEPLPRYLQCVCGIHVIERGGLRYDLAGQPHKHDAPKPVVARPAPVSKAGILSEGMDL
jgi:hypothetical protein